MRLHLAADERLLWEGRPDTRPGIRRRDLPPIAIIAVSCLIGGGAGLAMGHDDPRAPVWTLVLFGFCLVLGIALPVLMPFAEARRRRRTAYALTDRRALIGGFGPVRSYPVAEWHAWPELRDDGRGLASVVFAERVIGRTSDEVAFAMLPAEEAAALHQVMSRLRTAPPQ